MSKRSLRFPSILTRHTTQPARDATVAGTGTPAAAPRRQRQGIFHGLLSMGKRRSADGPPSAGTQTGSPPRITAASPRLSRKARGASLPETPSAAVSGVTRQAPKPPASDGLPSRSPGTASLPKTDSGRVDADVLAASADLSDAGWGIRALRDARLNAAQEGGVEAAPVTITPHPGATSEIEEVPVPDTVAPAPAAPGTKPARGTAVMPLNRQTPSPPGTSPIRATPGINRMPSGLKFDGTHEPSTLMRSLDDKTLTAITEALGLGPLDSATPARNAQIDRAGRRLRNAVIEEAVLPPADTLRKLAFYDGLMPGMRGQLGLAATGADCVISEREQLDKHGKRKHLLRVQFHKSIDRGEYTLASQPGSPSHAAVQNVAQRLAEAIGPQYRTDERQYAIEFVGAMGHKGSSADVFIEHFAKHAKVKPRRIESTPSTINDAHLRNAEVFRALSSEQMNKLARAAHVSHLSLREETSTGRDGTVRHDLRLFFGGSENILRDYGQATVSAVGGVGSVLGAARKAAQIIAQAVEQLQRDGHEVRFESIGGVSMGGASAQVFAAALQSSVQLPAPTPLVLLDPQLLNDAQARHATKGGAHDYDFGSPRGVAITLDYPAAPHKSLMGRMKGVGYQSPGLVRIKLALQDGDSVKRLSSGEWVDQPPKPYGPPLTGYHGDLALYTKALLRFTGNPAG
ncbi:type III effector protein [Ralstonia solanacearum]|nr:type III effector protein [Ralstonia solanacearum]AMP77128.1 type III effector protein [Ralstonia solanacearum]MCL9857555.1 type III effector protein [Ralstonia solanacearum]MCM2259421.1 type III effector protein [Ralstonia solanacearum]OAI66981.1 type III effector protein [Ralstonia solanacearum]